MRAGNKAPGRAAELIAARKHDPLMGSMRESQAR